MAEFTFPREGYHTAVLGTTGSGKSTLAAHLLSRGPFHKKPQYILDYKFEDIFARSQRIVEVGVNDNLTRTPGIYIVRPRPDQEDEVETFFSRIWHHENADLYIDEAYLAPNKVWLRNLLAQGRSKNISIIASSQRPVDVPRSVFTEAAYVSVFRLNDKKDVQRVVEFTPRKMLGPILERDDDLNWPLQEYWSFWYSRLNHKAADPSPFNVLSPVPRAETIVELIDSRLRPRHSLL